MTGEVKYFEKLIWKFLFYIFVAKPSGKNPKLCPVNVMYLNQISKQKRGSSIMHNRCMNKEPAASKVKNM
jgi:hypothetical protein